MKEKTVADLFMAKIGRIETDNRYYKRCLECQFIHGKEERNIDIDPDLILTKKLFDSDKFEQAITLANKLSTKYEDFDCVYLLIAEAYTKLNRLENAKATLNQGLLKSKRKHLLLTKRGEVELALGNIDEAIFWWCQALAGLSFSQDEIGAYLYLGSVAEAIGCNEFATCFFNRANIIFVNGHKCGCTISLFPETVNSIKDLVLKSDVLRIIHVLRGLFEIYYI